METKSIEWIKKQIIEFKEEYESQSDRDRCSYIDGKISILNLWLEDKKLEKQKDKLEIEFLLLDSQVKGAIKECEGKHIQQIAYSSYHDALTQICFGCKKVRTSLSKDALGMQDEVKDGN